MVLSSHKTVCPHDCPDTCSILATVEDGRVTACDGDSAHPFFHHLGAAQLKWNIRDTAAEEASLAPYERCVGADREGLVASNLVIPWGINTVHTNIQARRLLTRARRNGARLVVIDPYRHRTAKLADTHLMPRPMVNRFSGGSGVSGHP